MDGQDNKACEIAYQATCKHNGKHDWVTYMLGWQAALEYARGQQEPVAWAVIGKREVSCHGPNRKYVEGIIIQQLKEIEPDTPLYAHPKITNQKPVGKYVGTDGDYGHDRVELYTDIAEGSEIYTTPPAQPVQPAARQEPVAGVVLSSDGPSLVKRGTELDYIARNGGSLLYTHPAQPVATDNTGLIKRIDAAIERVTQGRGLMSIPADPRSDVDLVLSECKALLEGKNPPFWATDFHPAQPVQPAIAQEPVGEIQIEDMGKPFNAARVRVHFYKEVPPVGAKIYTEAPAVAQEPVVQRTLGYEQGIQAVAKMLDTKADDYAKEFGFDDMGALEFSRESQREYHSTLIELAEEVRSMVVTKTAPAVAQGEPVAAGEEDLAVYKRIADNYSRTPPAACQYCNGTGDVHGIDGEWRGECKECKPAGAKGEAVLQRVMGRLADLLDEDQFAEIEGIVVSVGIAPPPATVQPAGAKGEAVDLRELFERLLFGTYAGKDSYYNDEQIKHGCFERAQELVDVAKRMNIALYTAPPAVAVNEQMFEALRAILKAHNLKDKVAAMVLCLNAHNAAEAEKARGRG